MMQISVAFEVIETNPLDQILRYFYVNCKTPYAIFLLFVAKVLSCRKISLKVILRILGEEVYIEIVSVLFKYVVIYVTRA